MSADGTTCVVAILGAIGTLSSPLLTQRIADRGKRQEFEFEVQRRRADRIEGHRRAGLSERRAIYAQAKHDAPPVRTGDLPVPARDSRRSSPPGPGGRTGGGAGDLP